MYQIALVAARVRRISVQAAAANTSTLETITGFEAISTPNVIQSTAPSICKPRSMVGFGEKYDATKTAVAIQPTESASDTLIPERH